MDFLEAGGMIEWNLHRNSCQILQNRCVGSNIDLFVN
jgi:hypothetical protein